MNTPRELGDWQDYLEAAFAGDGSQPMQVRVYQQTRSTQDIAKTFAQKKVLIIADQQTAGRGRLSRTWSSAAGSSVLMSLVWPSEDKSLTHDRVSVLSGLAVARAVEQCLRGVEVQLKWPNDVMLDGKKLAGILIEAIGRVYVIGIGLNVRRQAVADPVAAPNATCLDEHGPAVERLHVIESIVTELDRILVETNSEELLSQWRQRAALGQTQTFEHNHQRITGEVLDLDPDHGLIVRRDTGEIVTLPAATTSVVK